MKYKIEKIVEYLREISHPESVVGQAVTMLEQLQAENDRLRKERDAAVKDYRVLPEKCVCITTCGGKKVTIVLDVEAVKEAAHD